MLKTKIQFAQDLRYPKYKEWVSIRIEIMIKEFTVGKEDVWGFGATCTSLNSPKSSSSSSSSIILLGCSSLDDWIGCSSLDDWIGCSSLDDWIGCSSLDDWIDCSSLDVWIGCSSLDDSIGCWENGIVFESKSAQSFSVFSSMTDDVIAGGI